MYSSSTAEPLHFAQAVSFLRRVIPDADYGSMLYTVCGSRLMCIRVRFENNRARVHAPCFRDPYGDLYDLSVRHDGWQRSSLELHCRRCETAVVYMCIIGVPRGTGTKFYTRVSPFTTSAHEYACFSCISAWIGRLECNISTWYSIYTYLAFIRDKYEFNVLSISFFLYFSEERKKNYIFSLK